MPRTLYRQQFLQELKEAIETLILVEMHMIHLFTPCSSSSTSSVDLLHSTNRLLQVLLRPSVDGALRFYIAALQQRYLLLRTEENFTGDDAMFYEIGAGNNDSEVSELDPDNELNQGVAAGAHNGHR